MFVALGRAYIGHAYMHIVSLKIILCSFIRASKLDKHVLAIMRKEALP